MIGIRTKLNHKLYNQYFPITTDDAKTEFLTKYRNDIIRVLENITTSHFFMLRKKTDEYIKQLMVEPPTNDKYDIRKSLNNITLHKMARDKTILKAKERLDFCGTIMTKLSNPEDVAFFEVNTILCLLNYRKKADLRLILSGLCLIILFMLKIYTNFFSLPVFFAIAGVVAFIGIHDPGFEW